MTAGRRDPAADAAIAALLGVGAACWVGLLLGLAGWFHVAVVAPVGLAAWGIGWWGRCRIDDPRPRPWIDAALLFVTVAAVSLPGYDTSLFASDATVYLGMGAHLARAGALWVSEPWLARMPPAALLEIFPLLAGGPDPILSRSPLGLAFRGVGPTWSSFPQLPSVWLGIGWALGGVDAARWVTPLLGAGGVTAVHLLMRPVMGVWPSLLGAGMLALSLPQLFFSRLTMGEIGAQYLLWTGCLALYRWEVSGARVAAIACGIGIGLAATARPEYLAFVPVAVAIGWVLGDRGRTMLPRPAMIALAILWVQAAVIPLAVVPGHYVPAVRALFSADRLADVLASSRGSWAVLLSIASVAGVALVAVRGRLLVPSILRVVLTAGLALWGVVYASLTRPEDVGSGFRLLSTYMPWPLLALCALGLPVLVRDVWGSQAPRLAVLVGLVAAAHLLFDPHATPLPVWAGRRLMPAALPVLLLAGAALVAAIGRRWGWGPAIATAAVLITLDARAARPVVDQPYFQGASGAVAEIAALIPPDAVVLIDPSLSSSGIDVALWLGSGRDAIQLRGAPESLARFWELFFVSHPRPLYVIRNALASSPAVQGGRAEPAGDAKLRLPLPGSAVGSVLADRAIFLRVYRVRLAAG